MSRNDHHIDATSGDLRPGLMTDHEPIAPLAQRLDELIGAPVDTLSQDEWDELENLQTRCRLAINEAERLRRERVMAEEERRMLEHLMRAAPCAVCGEEWTPKAKGTDWCDECETIRRWVILLVECGHPIDGAETLAATLLEHEDFESYVHEWLRT